MTSRRRIAAGFTALLTLTGALVLGGVVAANADDGLEITTTSLTWTSGPTTIQGTASAANQGTIEIRQGTDPAGGIVCSTPWAANWTCTTSLPVGNQELTARQADDPGNGYVARLDTTTVAVGYPSPNVTSADPLPVVAGETVTVSGVTTYPGVTISVTTSSPVGDCSVGTPIPTEGTAWSCDLETDGTATGDFALWVAQQIGGVDVGTPWQGTLSISEAPSDLAFTMPAPGSTISWADAQGGVTFSGTSIHPVDVDVYVDGETFVCTAAVVAGAWSCDATIPLPIGTSTYTAWQVVDAGPPPVDVYGFLTLTVALPTPTVSAPLVVPAGGTVELVGDGGVAGGTITADVTDPSGTGLPPCSTGPLAADGPWTCDIPFDTELPPGTEATVTVTLSFPGATSTTTTHRFQIAPAPPAQVTLDTPTDGQIFTWQSGPFAAVSGGAPVGSAPVDVLVDGVPVPACSVLAVDGFGRWDCGTLALDIGERTITAQQLDGATLVTDAATVDVQAPAPEVGGLPLSGQQGDSSYAVGGTYALAGYVVTATLDDGGTEVGSCTDDTFVAGAWSCDLDLTGLAPSPYYSLSVVQRPEPADPSITSQTATYFLEVTAPSGLQITAPADGDVLDWTADGVTVSGTTADTIEPLTVWLDGEFEVCSIADPTPNWTCPEPLSLNLGSYFLTVQQGEAPDATVTFDVVMPPPDVDQAGYSYPVGTAFAEFSGGSTFAPSDVLVELEVGDGATRDCTDVDPGSGWSCQIAIDDLPAGAYNVFFSQSTETGDPSLQVTRVLELTSTVPLAPVLTCTFTPGGFSVSSPQQMSIFDVYTATPVSGGGAGGGGATGEAGEPGSCNGAPGTTFPTGQVFEFGGPVATCAPTCSLTGLAPGIYDVYYTLDEDDPGSAGYSTQAHDYFFTIPETPSIGVAAGSGDTVLLSGTATAGDALRVVGPTGIVLCSTTVGSGGTWSCAFPKSSATSARVLTIDPSSGGMSSYSEARSIPALTPAAPTTPRVVPTLPADPTATTVTEWFLEFGGDLMNLKPGDTFTVTISGMPEGWSFEVIMHSAPRLLDAGRATGAPIPLTLTVPDDIENGPHQIQVAATTPLGTSYYRYADAAVSGGVDVVETPVDAPASDGDAASGTGGGAGAIDRADPGAPSALSESLAPLERIVANPVSVLVAGGLALALLFLVALPTELLNSSLSSNTSRLGRAYGAVDGAMNRAQDWLIAVTRSRAAAAAIVLALVAIIYGFVDPGFGLDVVSLRLVLALGLALFVLTYGASWISGLIIRRAWGASGVVAIQPSIILFAIVGVVVARILDFSPGFLVGVAIGLELISASKRVSGRAVFVQLGVVTGLSLAAWVVYSLFTPGDDFAGVLVNDTMVAITAEGLTGALIAILPLTFFDGRELWDVSKRLWVTAFLVVATAFALLVLPTAVEGTEVADYGVWLLVFAVFGLLSLAVWLVFARAAKREEQAEAEKVDA